MMIKVCFVCYDAYGMFRPESELPVGGAQFRSYWLARGLSERGEHEVSFLVYDMGQPKVQWIDGVRVLRSAHKRLYSLFSPWTRGKRAMRDRWDMWRSNTSSMESFYNVYLPRQDTEDADVCLLFGLNAGTQELCTTLAQQKTKVVLFLTHDEDVSPDLEKNPSGTNRHGAPFSAIRDIIDSNDVFVCQNRYQLDRLCRDFHKKAWLLKNPVELTDAQSSSGEFVLWVGRDHRVKRPLVFTELARLMPQTRFVMVLNRQEEGDFDQIAQTKPENLELIAHVNPSEIEEHYFARAKVFVSTSESEGFPNTFLQAGKFSVPVVSLSVDPEGYIRSFGCGKAGFGAVSEMAEYLVDLLANEEQLTSLGQRHFDYVASNHGLDVISNQLDTIIRDVLR